MTPEEREACGIAHNQMAAEAIACSPDSWNSGVLTVECDGNYLSYRLKNEPESDKAQISGELRSYCEEFAVLMWNSGDQWSRANVNFFQEDGEWKYKTTFDYDQPASDRHMELKEGSETEKNVTNSMEIEQPDQKPWWKFW